MRGPHWRRSGEPRSPPRAPGAGTAAVDGAGAAVGAGPKNVELTRSRIGSFAEAEVGSSIKDDVSCWTLTDRAESGDASGGGREDARAPKRARR